MFDFLDSMDIARTPCEEYGHDMETDPEDITLHACMEPGCGFFYRD
jgi:hypothetical protein